MLGLSGAAPVDPVEDPPLEDAPVDFPPLELEDAVEAEEELELELVAAAEDEETPPVVDPLDNPELDEAAAAEELTADDVAPTAVLELTAAPVDPAAVEADVEAPAVVVAAVADEELRVVLLPVVVPLTPVELEAVAAALEVAVTLEVAELEPAVDTALDPVAAAVALVVVTAAEPPERRSPPRCCPKTLPSPMR